MKKCIFYTWLCLLFISCQKENTYTVQANSKKLVIESYLTAGDTIKAFCLPAGRHFDYNIDFNDTLTQLLLWADNQIIDTLFPTLRLPNMVNQSQPLYNFSSQTVAKQGATYRLTALRDELVPAASLESIPEAIVPQVNHHPESKKISLRITDDASQENFYAIQFINQTIDEEIVELLAYHPSVEVLYGNSDFIPDDEGTSGKLALISDRFFNGETQTFDFYYRPVSGSNTPIKLVLSALSKNYYQYELSKASQYSISIDLLSEIGNLKGNIENGYGAFIGKSDYNYSFFPL